MQNKPRQNGSAIANSDDQNLSNWSQLDHSPTFSHGIPAWLLSLSLHAALLLALGMMVRVSYRGASLEPARGGGIVLARDVNGAAEYFGDGEDSSSSPQTASDSQDGESQALPGSQELPVDLAGALPEAVTASEGSDIGETLPSASGFTAGARPSGGRVGGDQAHTSIFGAEGTGNKFVYVFDRSASMDGFQGRPLTAAKRELIGSLQDLDKVHQFQIIFYNDRPTVFNPLQPQPPQMLFGDAQTRRLAQNFVRGVISAGGTKHMEALRLALGMQPDVVFFLTDAAEPQLTPTELDEIRRRNARVGATINAIEFGTGAGQNGLNFLKRLARQNGGQHVYIDVTRLPLKR